MMIILHWHVIVFDDDDIFAGIVDPFDIDDIDWYHWYDGDVTILPVLPIYC